MTRTAWILWLAVLALGCDVQAVVPHDASRGDAGPDAHTSAIDGAMPMATMPDAAIHDAGPHDGGPRDAGSHDAGPRDAGLHDAAIAHDAGAPAATSLPIPASLIRALSAHPYVEGTCSPITVRGWPHPAQRCSYGAGLHVTVADPTPTRVAHWIVEAAQHIPAVAALRTRDPAHYEACLVRIARHTMGQSSRIFPISGQISEDVVYEFRDGVAYGYGSLTRTCRTCYCRIDSLSRAQWCAYRAGTGHGTESACLASFGGNSGWNDAWAHECIANHSTAWSADVNEHYRAQAWVANEDLRHRFPHPTTADGAAVLAALSEHYPTY